ncbi:lysylphosphatidylglycerol synthase transmembrane domain-containing protein [Mycoplasmoides alvi]|uniref:lysylphosphatidylglycerol synthase transmembrane domain-containing protein n=1 Tax=Mycoplasmoides alvi TaxID=78580 RepID=UPI0012EB320C|nr:YbhN family protein [Mycoplasmoides alvi]
MNKNKATQKEKNPNFWNKKNISIGIILVVILLLVITLTSVFLFQINFGLILQLANTNVLSGKEGFLIGLIFMYLYQWIWHSFSIFYNAKKFNVKAKWYEWIIFGATIIFINGITPFALGSEPYKVYWLSRHGLSSNDSLLVVSSTSIYWTITQIIITWPSFIIVSTHYSDIVSQTKGIIAYWFSFGGMLLDILVFASIVTISYSSKFHLFCTKIYNKLLRKFNHSYKTEDELILQFREKAVFKKAWLQELKRWDCLIVQSIGTAGVALLQYSGIYFSIQLLGVDGIEQLSYSDMFNLSNVAVSGNNFIPIPGAEGSIQLILNIFIQAFASSVITNPNQTNIELNQAIFVWRSFAFYLPVLTGLLFLPYVLWYHIHNEKNNKYKTSNDKKIL